MTDTVHSVIETQLAALGIPPKIDTVIYPSIVALFEEALATFREEAACSSVGHTLSYGELDRLSADFAGWLQNGAGLSRGDRDSWFAGHLLRGSFRPPRTVLGGLREGGCVQHRLPGRVEGSR